VHRRFKPMHDTFLNECVQFFCGKKGVQLASQQFLNSRPFPFNTVRATRRFKPMHDAVMNERVQFICGKEGVQLSEESMATLGVVSNGDLRRAITTLQSAVRLAGPVVQRWVDWEFCSGRSKNGELSFV